MLSEERGFLLLNAVCVPQRRVQHNNRDLFHPNKPLPQGLLINHGQLHNTITVPSYTTIGFQYYRHALSKRRHQSQSLRSTVRLPLTPGAPVITGLP